MLGHARGFVASTVGASCAPVLGALLHTSGFAAAAANGHGQHMATQDGPADSAFAAAVGGGGAEPAGGSSVLQAPAGSASYRPVVSGNVLKRHGRDLTLEAAEGRLDPLIGRQDVLERALQVLLRRTKNNPVLIGDPGVGKTAVAEGIAQLIVSPLAPPGLAGRALISLDVGSLVAGTQYRGAFEERLTSLLNEVRMAAGRVVLFIDELHILMDAGRVEGGMNAANLLKPALARGELHCIGATTVEEYRRHIEADGAFARRFQPVMVEEPTPEEALSWLQGLRGRYERYHGVRYTDAALEAAVRAAQRYIPDRRLPDSAIDVIDEAAARARLHSAVAARTAAAVATAAGAAQAQAAHWQGAAAAASGPARPMAVPPIDAGVGQDSNEQARRLAEWMLGQQQQQQHHQQQSPQEQGLRQASGAAVAAAAVQPAALGAADTYALSCPHCGTPAVPLEGSVTVTCSKCRFVYLAVPQEKLLLGASLFAKSLNQQQRNEQAVPAPTVAAAAAAAAASMPPPAAAAWAPAAALAEPAAAGPAAAAATSSAPAPATKLAAAQAAAAAAALPTPPGPVLVDAADVLQVVAEASGIPAEHLSQTDWQPLAQLEARLRTRIAGQDAAVAAAVGAVRLARLGLQRGSRPLAALLLTGRAGVGKATLCQALADAMYGSDRHLLRFNLAEFADRASVSRLVGAPPGYVGYGDGGLLTEAVRRRPHSVVLLERVDRAHPEVLSLVMQVLESGQLQDSMGKRCDFRNALLVLTTSPTDSSLPPGWAAVAAAAAPGSGSGSTATTTVVGQSDSHVHPEAYAGDSSDASSASGGHHSAHSAAAQCLQPEEEPSPAAQRGQQQPGQQQQQQRGQQQQQPVHPLRLLPAELLSRMDAAVSMQPLGAADMERVVELQLAGVRASLQEQGIDVQVEPSAMRWLATRGLSPVSGAQRLQSLLREQLLLPVAEELLQQRVQQQQQEQLGWQAQPGAGEEPAGVAGGSRSSSSGVGGRGTVAVARLAADGERLEVTLE